MVGRRESGKRCGGVSIYDLRPWCQGANMRGASYGVLFRTLVSFLPSANIRGECYCVLFGAFCVYVCVCLFACVYVCAGMRAGLLALLYIPFVII